MLYGLGIVWGDRGLCVKALRVCNNRAEAAAEEGVFPMPGELSGLRSPQQCDSTCEPTNSWNGRPRCGPSIMQAAAS